MWLLLADGLLGNLDAGVFLMLRSVGQGAADQEIVHVNLRQPRHLQELQLLRGDESTCGDAFEILADDLEAEDVLIQLLEADASDEVEAVVGPGKWLEIDERTLFDLDSSAVLTVSEESGSFGVLYGAGEGSLAIFTGSEDEADAYLNALASILGSSDALLEAESESDLRYGAFAPLLNRVKKGQA